MTHETRDKYAQKNEEASISSLNFMDCCLWIISYSLCLICLLGTHFRWRVETGSFFYCFLFLSRAFVSRRRLNKELAPIATLCIFPLKLFRPPGSVQVKAWLSQRLLLTIHWAFKVLCQGKVLFWNLLAVSLYCVEGYCRVPWFSSSQTVYNGSVMNVAMELINIEPLILLIQMLVCV